jgi:hypothetical protein
MSQSTLSWINALLSGFRNLSIDGQPVPLPPTVSYSNGLNFIGATADYNTITGSFDITTSAGAAPVYFAALSTLPAPGDGRGFVLLDGYASQGDGGGGMFVYRPSSAYSGTDSGTYSNNWVRVDAIGATVINANWFGGAPATCNYFNSGNGKWYVDSVFSVEATDCRPQDSLALTAAFAVALTSGGATVYLPAGNRYYKTTAGPNGEFLVPLSNVSWKGDGRGSSIIRVAPGLNTVNGWTAWLGTATTSSITVPNAAVNNVDVSGIGVDGNSDHNQWPGANFGSTTYTSNTAFKFPAGNNIHIHDCAVYNANGVFDIQIGTYGFPFAATNSWARDNLVYHIADDPNMGDSSRVSLTGFRVHGKNNTVDAGTQTKTSAAVAVLTSSNVSWPVTIPASCTVGFQVAEGKTPIQVALTAGSMSLATFVAAMNAQATTLGQGTPFAAVGGTHFTVTGSTAGGTVIAFRTDPLSVGATIGVTSNQTAVGTLTNCTAFELHGHHSHFSGNIAKKVTTGFILAADSFNSIGVKFENNIGQYVGNFLDLFCEIGFTASQWDITKNLGLCCGGSGVVTVIQGTTGRLVDVTIEGNRFVQLVPTATINGIDIGIVGTRLKIKNNDVIGFAQTAAIHMTSTGDVGVDNEISDNRLDHAGTYGVLIENSQTGLQVLRNKTFGAAVAYVVQITGNTDAASLFWGNEAPGGCTAIYNYAGTNAKYWPTETFAQISVEADNIGNPVGLTVASQFANTTAATSGTPVQRPPSLVMSGTYWNGSASIPQYVNYQFAPGGTAASLEWSLTDNGTTYYPLYYVYDVATGVTTLAAGTGAGQITINSAKLAFYDGTPVVQPTRVGQVTDSTGGSPGSTLSAQGSGYSQTAINNALSTIAAYINQLEAIIHNVRLSA